MMSSVLAAGRSPGQSSRSASRVGSPRLVRTWLYGLACLVLVMIAIGGATRLTGSGLSITEWKPVTGAVPPVSESGWAVEFEKYRASSQYQNLNRGMELPEFKTIYWWEWSHRQLGRFIGLFFFGPLLWFWFSGAVATRLAAKLVGIGLFGAFQAAVGWIMVASGLEPGMVAVAPVKLTLHLVIASAILAVIVSVAAGLGGAGEGGVAAFPGRARARDITVAAHGPERDRRAIWSIRAAYAFLGLVVFQVALGGLVAGSRSGLTYNTWPLMDGRLVPPADALFTMRPWIENLVANPALVQLNHRVAAYLVVATALCQAWAWRRADPGSPGTWRAAALAGLALAQMALGIATLLLAVPLWAGLAHQVLAMSLVAGAAYHARLAAA